MTEKLTLPELGENVESADLIKVMVSVGDKIERDQPVLELETDKADFELPSSVSGIVKEIHVKEGEKIKVGQLILTVEEKAETGGEKPRETVPAEAPAPPPASRAVKKEPEKEPEKESEPAAGPSGPPAEPPAEKPKQTEEREPPGAEGGRDEASHPVPATPTVRRLARELGVAIEKVPGSGPAGRILADDVKAYVKRAISGAGESRGGAGMKQAPLPDFSRWGEVERKPMSGIRRKIAETMSYAWNSIPHVTNFESADITDLEQLRRKYSGEVAAAGGKLTVTSVAVKVVASALKVFPNFAASVDIEREEIIVKKYCHIGVAVDTDRGLIVPVIRGADRKNIVELSQELAQLAEKARSRKISLEEMEGGVFTVTNLGGIGGTQFSPIIHAPEVAILGLSRARQEAIYRDGRFEPRLMLPLALSYDHRLIDGADAARFLKWVAQALEQPFLLPLQG